LKPTFFLARIAGKETVEGTRVFSLGTELARDLLTLPAFLQDGCILLRLEAAPTEITPNFTLMTLTRNSQLVTRNPQPATFHPFDGLNYGNQATGYSLPAHRDPGRGSV
jgi:hypothetical protein